MSVKVVLVESQKLTTEPTHISLKRQLATSLQSSEANGRGKIAISIEKIQDIFGLTSCQREGFSGTSLPKRRNYLGDWLP